MSKKNFKNALFWIVFFPLFYTLSGYIVVPWWIKNALPDILEKRFHLHVSIEAARFNPFSFELHLERVSVNDASDKKAIVIEHAYGDYEPSYLLKKELFIRSLILDMPQINATIDSSGKLNLLELLSSFQTVDSPVESDTSSLSALMIEHFSIHQGMVHFSDERPKTPFEITLNPIDYTIHNFSLNKDDLSIHALKIALQNEEKITLESSATFEPMRFHGKLVMTRLPLSSLYAYTLPSIPARLHSGELSFTLPFSIDLSKSKPAIAVEHASSTLENIHFVDEHNKTIATFPNLNAEDINFDLNASSLSIAQLNLLKPSLDVHFEAQYTPNLVRLFTPPSSKEKTASSAWHVALSSLRIDDATIELTDDTLQSAPIKASTLFLEAKNLSNDPKKTILYELNSTIDDNASLKLQGSVIPQTSMIDARIDVNALSLKLFQPYLTPYTTLLVEKGALSVDATLKGTMNSPQPALTIDGFTKLSDLSLLDRTKTPLIAWEDLMLQEVHFSSFPHALTIKTIELLKPYVNLDIKKDKRTNFDGIIIPSTTTSTPVGEPLKLFLESMKLKEGRAHFKDASLPIPFATFIHQLNGNLSTLDTQNTRPSVLKLDGKVDKYGYAKIEGTLLPFDFKHRAELKLLFKNIDMPSLTPYSGKFIGYAIQKGKLSVDLAYKISQGIMDGSNKINLDSLTLGEKIESDEAVNLPLGLAIAILKDSKGQIDLDLPVNGDLNDPNFRYGSVIVKAFGNVIGGILSSPFKLLGSMLGIEAEQLKSIDFMAGDATLIASEEEKMQKYAQILEQRKALKLLITPSYNEDADTKFLKEQKLNARIETLLPKNSSHEDSYSKAIQTLYSQQFSEEAYRKLMKQYQEARLDKNAINDALLNKLKETITVGDDELKALARKRFETIAYSLKTTYHIAPQRIIEHDITPSEAVRETWIGCEVSVSN